MRAEFSSIEDGFDLLPALSAGAASRAVVVASNGLSLTITTGTLALAGNFATTGAFALTMVVGAAVSVAMPIVSGLTLATLTGIETLTNKTLVAPALGTPISGIATNLTGTAAGLTAGNVTTNANMTGPITGTGNVTSITAQTGTGTTFAMQASPAFTTPSLGAATATSINGLTITSSTGALTITNAKTLSVAKTLTLDGTDSTTMTFPTTSASIARTDAGQTFTGTQAFGAITYSTLNGNTWAAGTGTLSIAAGKTLTASNTLTFTGTDSSSVAFGTGGTVLYTASTMPLTIGSTTIASGTTTRVLYDNGGVLGEYTISGSGSVAMTTSPAFSTPNLGTPSALVLTNATGLPLTTGVTGTLPAANGGTAQSTYATGDTLYASALNTLSKLTIGSSGQVLTVAAGVPSWATLSSSAVTTFSAGTTGLTPSSATSGAITLAGTLAVTNGGTGVTSSTGTGSVVLSASPTLTGTLTVPAITASGFVSVGTLGVGTTTVAGGVADFKAATNKHLSIRQASDIGGAATAVMIEAYNDGAAALIPLEIEASTVKINPIVGGAITLSGATTMSNALTYGGVTLSNSVTGTGSMALSASPTFTGTLTAAAVTITGTVNLSTAAVSPATMGMWNGGGTVMSLKGGSGGYSLLNNAVSVNNWLMDDSGNVTMRSTATLSYAGTTLAASVTGTGSMVLSASPTLTGTLTAPTLNTSSSALQFNGVNQLYQASYYTVLATTNSVNFIQAGNASDPQTYYNNGTHLFRNAATTTTYASISSALFTSNVALNYGGVTLSNSVTGTGSMVLSASPTLTGTVALGGALTITNNAGGAIEFGQSGSSNTPYFDWHSSASATDHDFRMQATGGTSLAGAGAMTFSGGSFTVAATTTLSSALTYGGVTLSNSVTGTGSMVLSASPTLTGNVTINVAAATYSRLTISNSTRTWSTSVYGTDLAPNGGFVIADESGATQRYSISTAGVHAFTGSATVSTTLGVTGATTLSAALTYGGVTLSNAVTGTGSMVLSASPTLTGTVTAAAVIGNTFAVTASNVNAQTGTSYTLVAADNGKVVSMSNASASTLTVPSGLTAGFSCTIVQLGAGQVTITASSTTLRNRNGLKLAGQYAQAGLVYLSSETYSVGGDLST